MTNAVNTQTTNNKKKRDTNTKTTDNKQYEASENGASE